MNNQYPVQSDDLRDYLAKHYPNAVVSNFASLSGGWECDIYAFTLTLPDGKSRDLILRVYLGNDGAQKTTREGGGMRQLYRMGYPVPEVLLYETDSTVLGQPFIIMDRLNGQNLWPVLSSAAPQQESHLLEQFCRLLARLHRLNWQPFTEHAAHYLHNPVAVLDDLLADYRRLYVEYEVEGFLAITDWLEAHKTKIVVQPTVVHLDFHANNIFLHGDGRMSVIDWSQLGVADYRCDLSWTLMIMGDNGKPHWGDEIVQAYSRAAGHPVEHLDYFTVISYTKLLASTIVSLRIGAEKLGMRPQTDEDRKLQRDYILHASRRIQAITDLTVPEVRAALDQIG